jgi:hypothetical protein
VRTAELCREKLYERKTDSKQIESEKTSVVATVQVATPQPQDMQQSDEEQLPASPAQSTQDSPSEVRENYHNF